ncbi:hypothetical protein D0T50_01505 [Bacteroides sp. 214]|uniref:hypothetical protein n=1 Tax=Bacteroides sp. 214 TaxID=2302935 RepID=UPI0019402A09|nr:hypothetical protein [Bacteroides sp. 214]NDW11561.1 hypothetical protein [Bacteroides sp. 214]
MIAFSLFFTQNTLKNHPFLTELLQPSFTLHFNEKSIDNQLVKGESYLSFTNLYKKQRIYHPNNNENQPVELKNEEVNSKNLFSWW